MKKITSQLKPFCAGIAVCILFYFLINIITGAVNNSSRDTERKYNSPVEYSSSLDKSDCYLCGDNENNSLSSYWGEDNIGLINLNTFDCVYFEINRYDSEKNLIEQYKRYGTLIMSGGDRSRGSTIFYCVMQNRGYLDGQITLNGNSKLSADMCRYLCAECLNELMEQYVYDDERWDIAVIDFKDKKIRPLEKSCAGFQIGNYRISCRYLSESGKIDFIAFYCPVRYAEDESAIYNRFD